jgi:hypothetical protein
MYIKENNIIKKGVMKWGRYMVVMKKYTYMVGVIDKFIITR